MRRPAGVGADADAAEADADAPVMRRPAGVGADADAPVMRRPAGVNLDVIARMIAMVACFHRSEPRIAPMIRRKEERGKMIFQVRADNVTVGQTTVTFFGSEEHARDVAQGMAELWERGYSKEMINDAKNSLHTVNAD